MGKRLSARPAGRPPVRVLVIFCLCLSSLMAHGWVSSEGHANAWDAHFEHRDMLDHDDSHDHEDSFVFLNPADTCPVTAAAEMGRAYRMIFSLTPSPLLHPPKTV